MRRFLTSILVASSIPVATSSEFYELSCFDAGGTFWLKTMADGSVSGSPLSNIAARCGDEYLVDTTIGPDSRGYVQFGENCPQILAVSSSAAF